MYRDTRDGEAEQQAAFAGDGHPPWSRNASINMPGNVDPTNSKDIPVGSVRVHNDNYCFTDVGFVPHVVAVTPQRVSVAVSPSVTTDLTTTEWNFTCGSGTPKSPGSFVVQLFKPDNSQTTADFTVTVN